MEAYDDVVSTEKTDARAVMSDKKDHKTPAKTVIPNCTEAFQPVAEDEVETLFEFPCQFPVKAIGPGCDEMEAAVIGILRRHVKDMSESAVTTRSSKKGNYTAITVMITAHSKKQLDAIYMELSACEHVSIAL